MELVPAGTDSPDTPVIAEAGDYWRSIENAQARLSILAGGTAVAGAADTLRQCLYDLARAQQAR